MSTKKNIKNTFLFKKILFYFVFFDQKKSPYVLRNFPKLCHFRFP